MGCQGQGYLLQIRPEAYWDAAKGLCCRLTDSYKCQSLSFVSAYFGPLNFGMYFWVMTCEHYHAVKLLLCIVVTCNLSHQLKVQCALCIHKVKQQTNMLKKKTRSKPKETNKLASLEAKLVRNSAHLPTY